MDIHKPKPWHGVREFLKEYVIIVVGVLTALGAEQGVEWLHWQEMTQAGEAQLTRELSLSWSNARERVAVTDCLERRLDQIEDRLLQPGGPWTPLPPMLSRQREFVYFAPGKNWSDAAWRSLTADGTIGHLPRSRQLLLMVTFNDVAKLDRWNQDDLRESGELNVLNRRLVFDSAQRLVLAESVERERVRARASLSLSRAMLDGIPKLIQVTPLARKTGLEKTSNAYNSCKSLGLL